MKSVIDLTEVLVRNMFINESSGHDWYHMLRVRKNAMTIYNIEKQGDPFIIEVAALLHDVLDEKLQPHPEKARQHLNSFLKENAVSEAESLHIFEIIDSISYKGGHEKPLKSIEAKIVRDADRLDAIGAIGIARTFSFGGKKGHSMYDPDLLIREQMTLEEYRKGKSSSIHHFYEKLLKLKDLMQTESGRKLAEQRHQFMENYLEQFFKEWNGDL